MRKGGQQQSAAASDAIFLERARFDYHEIKSLSQSKLGMGFHCPMRARACAPRNGGRPSMDEGPGVTQVTFSRCFAPVCALLGAV